MPPHFAEGKRDLGRETGGRLSAKTAGNRGLRADSRPDVAPLGLP